MRIENDIIINAPVDVVWQLTVDVESWPASTPTIKRIERLDDGPIRPGSRAKVWQPAQRARLWTVTDVRPGELFEWEATTMGVRMVGSHRLTSVGDGCRNTLVIELSGRGAGLLGRLLRGSIRTAITRENVGFKQTAEAVAVAR